MLNKLAPAPGAKKNSKRIGRGHGSGHGKTSGKGHKGQKARSGGGVRPGFEGGQMPLQRRIPKRGFNNKVFSKKVAIVNVGSLNIFEDDKIVDIKLLEEKRLINGNFDSVKILANGKLTKKIILKVNEISKQAKEKVEIIGGKVEVI